jgi:hypothetical protein
VTTSNYGHPSPATPSTIRSQSHSPESQIQHTPSRSSGGSKLQQDSLATAVDEDDPFDFPLSNEDELIAATDFAVRQMSMPSPETPRKAQKTDALSTPGSKRRSSEMEAGFSAAGGDWRTPASVDDVFTTPKISSQPLYPRLQLPSPLKTPTPNRFKDSPQPYSHNAANVLKDQEKPDQPDPTTSLTTQILNLLSSHSIALPHHTNEALQDLLSRHELRTQGIIKGREISRLAIKAKDLKIAELQGRIDGLEAERETNRSVIQHLKSDILAASKKRRGPKRDGS